RRLRLHDCYTHAWPNCLAERETVGLNTGRQERDLERALDDGSRFTNQLMQPLLGQRSVTLFVDVEAVCGAGRFSVDAHDERHGCVSRRRSHDEMDVAGVEAEGDPPI